MIVICSKPGQLGNRLFIFASFVAFSREYNVRISNVSFDEYAQYFPFAADDVLCRYPLKKSSLRSDLFRKWSYYFFFYLALAVIRFRMSNGLIRGKELDWNEKQDMDDDGFVRMASETKWLLLQGWEYRCPATFQKHADFLRQLFTPAKHHADKV